MVTHFIFVIVFTESCSSFPKIFVKNQFVMRTNETILRICYQTLKSFPQNANRLLYLLVRGYSVLSFLLNNGLALSSVIQL